MNMTRGEERKKQFRKTPKREKEVDSNLYKDESEPVLKCYRCKEKPRMMAMQLRSKDNIWFYMECRKHPSNHTVLNKSYRSCIACWNFLQKKGRENLENKP